MNRILITGVGIISPLGNCLEQNHEGLKAGKCAISNLEFASSRYADLLPFGEIKIATEALKEKLCVEESGVTRTSLLALHAFEEALQDACLSSSELISEKTALIGANTVGGMCLTDELYKDANSTDKGSAYLSSYDPGSVNIFLQKRFKMKGIVNTINTACSSSANAIMYGARLIRNGLATKAIVGGTDSLAKFTINGFNALFILSPEICRPFDRERQGLNLGEGAAFLVLEREEDVKNKKIYAELSGWGNANDAFHPSSLSETGEGPFEAMEEALRVANIKPEAIDFVNAHGTGTENNDEVESAAMKRIYAKVPPFASTKSNIGHTLGASGAIEAVFSILNLRHQEVYESLNFHNPIPALDLVPVQTYSAMPVRHVMSNSFGFGGNCSSLIFSIA